MVLGSQTLSDEKLVKKKKKTTDEKIQINKIVHFIQTHLLVCRAKLKPGS